MTTKQQVERLQTFQKYIDAKGYKVGIIAVENVNPRIIIFAQSTEAYLGYVSQELINKPFDDILPESVTGIENFREWHNERLTQFAKEDSASEFRSMGSGRNITVLTKSKTEKKLRFAISYENREDDDLPGLFLAVIQDPISSDTSTDELNAFLAREKSVQIMFKNFIFEHDLVEQGKKTVKRVKRLWLKRVAAVGLPTALVGALTFSTQLSKGVRDLWGTLFPSQPSITNSTTGNLSTVVGYEPIKNDRDRLARLINVRNRLQQKYPEVTSVAFYWFEIDQFGGSNLRYDRDSNNVKTGGELDETYFYNLELTEKERFFLLNHECFYKSNLGVFQSREGQPKFDGILCPTFQIISVDGYTKARISNVIAICLDQPLDPTSERIQKLQTEFWEYGPYMDNLFPFDNLLLPK